MKIKKILSLIMCGIMCLGCFAGCDSSDGTDNESVAMEDLPYGTTLREIKDADIPITFDSRYFSDEAMRMLSDYFYSIQTLDAEGFRKTQNADYAAYLEKNSGDSLENFMNKFHDDYETTIGKGFNCVSIEVTDAGNVTEDGSIDAIMTFMDSLYEEAGKGSFKDTVKDAKYAQLSISAELDGNTYNNASHQIYIFECEDGTYIFD